MRNVPALTSIRFIAALVVIVHHYLAFGGGRHFMPHPGADWRFQVMFEGRFGVALFFVLSGFLLTARYYDTLHRRIGFRRYWIKRFARIMPLYWTICAITFVGYWAAGSEHLEQFFVYFTLTQSFFSDIKFGGVGPAWSLTVEECFYLTLPVLVLVFRAIWRERWRVPAALAARAGGATALGPRASVLVNLVLVSLALVGFVIFYYQLGRLLNRQETFTIWGFFRNGDDWRAYTICGRFFDFAIGCLFGIYYAKSANLPLRWRGFWADLVILASTAGIVWLSYKAHLEGGIVSKDGWRLNMVCASLGAVVIYFCCHDRSWIARILSWGPFVYLGLISYACYLIHVFFIDWMRPVVDGRGWNLGFFTSLLLLCVVINIVSAICYEVVERPCQFLILRATGAGRTDTPNLFRAWDFLRRRPARNPAGAAENA